MSLMGDYYNAVSLMKKDRMDRYAIDYANWQQGEANRSKMIGTAVGLGIGALTGGIGGLPFLGIGAGAGGALAGAGLSMIPGGLAMGTMQRAGTAETGGQKVLNSLPKSYSLKKPPLDVSTIYDVGGLGSYNWNQITPSNIDGKTDLGYGDMLPKGWWTR